MLGHGHIDGAPNSSSASWSDSERPFSEHLLRGLRCGYLAIDRECRVQELNSQACSILEVDGKEAIGRPIDAVLEDHPQFARALREAFTLHCLPNRAELELRCRSEERTIGFTLSLVRDDAGDPYGAAVLFKDLTRVEQQEEQERLKDRLAALGQMAASLAHEIRNPLASIEVSCSLLTRRFEKGGEERALLDKIVSEVRRLNGTIHSSLEYVRPVDLRPTPVRVDELLEAALQVALSHVPGDSVSIVQVVDRSLPTASWDRARIRQVFENLMINALEALAGAGTLTVRASRGPNDTIRIDVEDDGPGVPEDLRERLFYPFFTTKTTGSGVGLPVARKLVEAHRGWLDLAEVTGGGARFTVRLPIDVHAEG